ncbi:LytTR family transcriptional regulator [Lacihabitans sp. LS3-19]|uniref:LytTR family DNA-binding domain-containing protein n=1 Tax=Lacihabitans sp. LS3-19 TaxID=2487335 RepID=UPI0020CF6464|nr:LytTR family DNA-binding domain-containing protein [Lacihabitans sp. LS3-19]MCP9769056.1 LytTR family transcriptional regulator [Lacihabitans sp. LS3-19]
MENKEIIPISVRNFICPHDVLFFEANENYTKIHYIDGRLFIIAKTLKDIQHSVRNFNFIRPNRSVLLNACHVKQNSVLNETITLVLKNNLRFQVSRRRKDTVIKHFD